MHVVGMSMLQPAHACVIHTRILRPFNRGHLTTSLLQRRGMTLHVQCTSMLAAACLLCSFSGLLAALPPSQVQPCPGRLPACIQAGAAVCVALHSLGSQALSTQ